MQQIEKAARRRYRATPLPFAAEAPPIAVSCLEAGHVILAEEAGRLVGFVLLNEMDGLLYVANISVDIGFSGRGIGAALIEAAERHAACLRLPALALATFRTPRWNGPWFRRLGFEPMPAAAIGPLLREVIDRHRRFLDMRTRVTRWRPVTRSAGHCQG